MTSVNAELYHREHDAKNEAHAAKPRTSCEMLEWIDARDALPDDQTTVMVCGVELEPWPGWHEGGTWYTADAVDRDDVTHWAPMPLGPSSRR